MLRLNYKKFTDLLELFAYGMMNSPRTAWPMTDSAYSIELAIILSKHLNKKCKHFA